MKRIALILIVCWARLAFPQGSCSNFSGGSCPANIPSGVVHFYFIDYASGSDSNNGTSESTPWKNLPGSTPVVNNVGPGTIDDKAGDKCGSSPCNYSTYGFILKGGSTWPTAEWPMTMRLEGNSTTVVYWGVDSGWYSGGSWTRPILNFGGSSGPKCNTMIQWAPVTYVVWDNTEFTGLYWDHTCNGDPNGTETYLSINNSGHNTIEHTYMHGWSHEAYSPNNTSDVCNLLTGTTEGSDVGSSYHDFVVDGSDTADYACVAIWGSPNIVYNGYIRNTANGFVGLAASQQEQWYQNTCYNLQPSYDPTQHTQCYEENSSNGTLMYNNLDENSGTAIQFNLGPAGTSVDYIWNNVIANVTDNGNLMDCSYPASTTSGGSCYFFNNTVEGGVDGSNPSSLWFNCLTNLVKCVFENNHLISSNNQSTGCATQPANCVATDNIVQSQSVANANGYTLSGGAYPFIPTSSGGATVGAGANLTSTSPGCGTSGLSSLCYDTAVGVGENTSGYTVIVPNRTSVARPATGSWYADAYNALAAAAAPSCTPTSGNAPQSLTCSNTNSAPTVMCEAISPVTPVTNGLGTGCTTGNSLGTGNSESFSVLIGATYEFVAGTSALADSSVSSYTYTAGAIFTIAPSSGMFADWRFDDFVHSPEFEGARLKTISTH